MPTFRSQSEAARIIDVPESTLRSWIKKFRPYVIQHPGPDGRPVYDMDRLNELHYVCHKWAKDPIRRSLDEVGRELARRYPVEALSAGIKPPPEPDFETHGAEPAAAPAVDLQRLAPFGGEPSAEPSAVRAEVADALAALSLVPDVIDGLNDVALALARIPGELERALGTRDPERQVAAALAEVRDGMAGLVQAFGRMQDNAESLSALIPALQRQVEVTRENNELQREVLAFLRAQADDREAQAARWRWANPALWLAALILTLRGPAADDDGAVAAEPEASPPPVSAASGSSREGP